MSFDKNSNSAQSHWQVDFSAGKCAKCVSRGFEGCLFNGSVRLRPGIKNFENNAFGHPLRQRGNLIFYFINKKQKSKRFRRRFGGPELSIKRAKRIAAVCLTDPVRTVGGYSISSGPSNGLQLRLSVFFF